MNSKNFEALGLSLTSVPVASTVNPDFALFFVIKNVANDLKELRDSTLNSIIFTFGVILLIVGNTKGTSGLGTVPLVSEFGVPEYVNPVSRRRYVTVIFEKVLIIFIIPEELLYEEVK